MSKMPASHGHSEACCNIPPVVTSGYKAQGGYETIDSKKTYVVGPEDATKAIVYIFDIFGYSDQSLQGADILATSDSHNKYKVFMPDWFNGEPHSLKLFPPDTPEKQAALGAFLQKYSPPSVAALLPGYVAALKDKFPSIKSYYVIGFCWGGKVVSLTTSGDDNLFVAGAECHPAMVDAKDAAGIKVPLMLLASKDEDAKDVAQFKSSLKVEPNHVETFADQIHGWMAARADLADDRVKAEYIRGYKTVLGFFAKF